MRKRHRRGRCSRSFLTPLVAASVACLVLGVGVSIAPGADGTSDFAPIPKDSNFALTNAVILVSPTTLDFGSVALGKGATNTFLVENIGRGKLVGTASVPSPFKILSGGEYALTEKQVQVVTIAYIPGRTRAMTNTATVKFTGGGGAKAKVTGKRLTSQD